MDAVKYGSLGEVQRQTVTILPQQEDGCEQGMVISCTRHLDTQVFKHEGVWYIADDFRICQRCGMVVPRYNIYRDHGHGEKYGSVCNARTV